MRSLKLAVLAPLAFLAFPAQALEEAPVGPQPNVTVADLVNEVEIPFERFTLDNGLRVIVHEDHKAPVVAVSIWYHVGSRHEPEGQTGFAHLFEHLMFNGSENAPGDFFEPLREIGATDFNGTTWYDRTNYFQTVPTQGLELALYLESDRMGHLLGAVTQEKLDNQRGVVQNEKRQGDNQPYGLVDYAQIEALFGEDHPYGHSTIGSMADLDAASMEDVQAWFGRHYGPNNAVLVLAGDIDMATAREMVERYFGDIARGPETEQVDPGIPTLSERREIVMQDNVATTRLYRTWVVPGLNDPATSDLDVAASVFGGLASSRLDNVLVRDEQTAVSVTTFLQEFEYVSLFEVQVNVAPTADADAVSARLDELIADYIANGPTQDEVNRVAMSEVSGRIAGLEQVGGFTGKAAVLATGELYSNDPSYYRTRLERLGAVTPDSARAAMQQWLTRPVLAMRVDPGERGAYEEASSVGGERTGGLNSPAFYLQPGEETAEPSPAAASASLGTRTVPRPEVGEIDDLDFPEVERATLSNGVEVHFVRRTAVPTLLTRLSFDAGNAADRADQLGTQALMLSLMSEGTTTLNSVQIAEAQERLGAAMSASASLDRTSLGIFALAANYEPSLDLLQDVVRNPAFAPSEIERIRAAQLSTITTERTTPASMASLNLWPALFGEQHPYGRPTSGLGTPDSVAAITRQDLVDFHRSWIRPDKLTIMVVGDATLAEVVAALEPRFGDWTVEGEAGTKAMEAAIPAANPRIILVDRPNSPQSFIYGGQVLDLVGTDELLPLLTVNEALGGSFLSRLNMELRETRGWSYGVRGSVNRFAGPVSYTIAAPVQADRTGDSIAAMLEQIDAFLTSDGMRPEEFSRAISGSIRSLAGRFETSSGVIGGMSNNLLYGRSDDYYDDIAAMYRSFGREQLDATARSAIDPSAFTWVVVGDAGQVREQLDALGLPVETVASE
ncbi:M16 family metallopeptidase [Parasphingopyxis lamellibrachiae]|uniref:Putative Zn-dependent peptidase n=1 Tax=Parasphingopyxis lamellibrachiae TaxID=680125 RepID=A0A3D9FJJ3_9SPHN|nr:pitrilysin family protein [Parasphingopyxis lamellibrachiae]RED17256.1 putative Zn-dependent peptidase [Parasphingopyxis lamellibrachiae]